MRLSLRSPRVSRTRDLRQQPLEYRRVRLMGLLVRAKGNVLRFSDSFPDAGILLGECARLGLEGIVAMRKDSAYRWDPQRLDQGEDVGMTGSAPASAVMPLK